MVCNISNAKNNKTPFLIGINLDTVYIENKIPIIKKEILILLIQYVQTILKYD